VLEILADNEGIKEDMPAWCRTTGNELLGIEEKAGDTRFISRNQSREGQPSISQRARNSCK